MLARNDERWEQDPERLRNALKELGIIFGEPRGSSAASRPRLQPTVFVANARGAEVRWPDVVARGV